jgi:SAM-dependent methyltransferase
MKYCYRCGAGLQSENWYCNACQQSPPEYQGYLQFAPGLSEGFEPQFFENLAKVEVGHFWFEARNKLIMWLMGQYFPDARDFLEVGCGTGFVLSGIHRAFPHMRTYGSELFKEGLSITGRRLPDATLFQMDARKIPFECEFDVIGAFDVLEHIKEDAEVFTQMFRALRPGGGIIISVPQHPFLWSVVDEYSHHQRRYTRRELVKKVKATGFEVKRVTSFTTLLLPLMMLSRMTPKPPVQEYNPMAEFEINPGVNTLLRGILDLERLFIRAGLSFPAGGSLVLVAGRPTA